MRHLTFQKSQASPKSMHQRLINLILVFFIAAVVAFNGKNIVVIQDLKTVFHLVAHSSVSGDHHHDSETEQTQFSHRHSSEGPEHEHTLPNHELLSVDSFSVPSPNLTISAVFSHYPTQNAYADGQSIDLNQYLSSLFRPPIFHS